MPFPTVFDRDLCCRWMRTESRKRENDVHDEEENTACWLPSHTKALGVERRRKRRNPVRRAVGQKGDDGSAPRQFSPPLLPIICTDLETEIKPASKKEKRERASLVVLAAVSRVTAAASSAEKGREAQQRYTFLESVTRQGRNVVSFSATVLIAWERKAGNRCAIW